MAKVLILGGSGMLGSAMVSAFYGFGDEVFATFRATSIRPISNCVNDIAFEAEDSLVDLLTSLNISQDDFIINCIGMVKAHIDDDSESSRKRAIELNTLLPHRISEAVAEIGCRAIQIATDCVYSGNIGSYDESAAHDASDVYGKTKSLGEVPHSRFMHIRSSIIGRELAGHTSLVGWVSNLPSGSSAQAYSNHYWNGVGAIHFAKACRGIIENDIFRPGVRHFVPRDTVTKGELVRFIANQVGRGDLQFVDAPASMRIDRTLSTLNPEFSESLWAAAGYKSAPTIAELVSEI